MRGEGGHPTSRKDVLGGRIAQGSSAVDAFTTLGGGAMAEETSPLLPQPIRFSSFPLLSSSPLPLRPSALERR